MSRVTVVLTFLVFLLLPVVPSLAQDTSNNVPASVPALPVSYQMTGFQEIPQHWNNCGPATLTMGLTYFGLPADQDPAAAWLKPTSEDGNVSPWQVVEYVNNHLATNIHALVRVGGDLDTLKTLLNNNYPTIIEMGYDPEPQRLGWMGHYLLVTGYDDAAQQINSNDSYLGANQHYSYDHINQFWEHFDNTYIVLYKLDQEQALMTLLGNDADPTKNFLNALELNRQRAVADATDKYAWFNLGTNYVDLADYDPKAYQYAAAAFDQARSLDLPWRMLWYQFGPYEAYIHTGRYQDVLDLVHTQLSDTGTSQYIEETFYYAGLAREGLGDTDRALQNYNQALSINPNFTPARTARDRLAAGLSNINVSDATTATATPAPATGNG